MGWLSCCSSVSLELVFVVVVLISVQLPCGEQAHVRLDLFCS